MYFIERIESIHYKNQNPTEVNEIPNSYDLRRGTAYYFTEKGNQLRQMPTYKADIEKEKKKKKDVYVHWKMKNVGKSTHLFPLEDTLTYYCGFVHFMATVMDSI